MLYKIGIIYDRGHIIFDKEGIIFDKIGLFGLGGFIKFM